MNRKITITALILLLVGAVAIAVVKTKNSGAPEESGTKSGGSPSGLTGTSSGGDSGPATKSTARSPREVRNADLADRYGASKTKLSRQVAGNVVTLLEDVISMGETMSKGPMRGSFGGGRMASRMALRGIDIELTEEQQDKVSELYQAFRDREMEKAKDAVNSLQKDPGALMELFLAGDAKAREEMTEAEYEAVVSSAGSDLTNVINPLDRNNFRGGSPMEDETFRRDFEAILDDEQTTTLNTSLAEREANAEPAAESNGNITNLPTMELETLDQAVVSAQKMTSGFKQVMEGMGSLQDLQPKIDPESTPEE
jgi:Spy/CpxP family protein refolding chaperone